MNHKDNLAFRGADSELDEISDLGWLWVLRLYASGMVPLDFNTGRDRVPNHLIPLINGDSEKINPQQLMVLIKSELQRYEAEVFSKNNVVFKNLKRLARKFGFKAIDIDVLLVRIIYRLHQGLEQTVDTIPENRWFDDKLYKFFAATLNRREILIRKSLADDGKLCASGLINVKRNIGGDFPNKITVMDGFVSAMNKPAKNIDELLSFALSKAPVSHLTVEHYSHQAEAIRLIQEHLANASKLRVKGVNILLYGGPGLGKTELARVLSTTSCMNAYNVTYGFSVDGDNAQSEVKQSRLRGYLLLQALLSQSSNGLAIFDEIEDVLPRPGTFENKSTNNKAWINQLLEENQVPSIWIANHVWQIDPAFMRRFDIVLEVKTPPRSVRRELLKNAFQELPVDDQWLDKKAGESDLTPALIEKSLRVLRHLNDQSSTHLQMQFDGQMKERRNAQGMVSSSVYPEPEVYQLDHLNTDTDMQELVNSLANNKRGKVLLFGPPGCGKTAFAYHLAKAADKPLMLKRASDLISKWLGETETNLRDMFEEASRDDAILLLDEADSFLQDRRSAARSWELTQVNELLTQMENFKGVFICATNFMEHLDQAAMRRFAIKLRFDYLKPEQIHRLFASSLQKLGSEQLNILVQQKLSPHLTAMRNLTPGDFKAVIDGFCLLDKRPSYDEFLSALMKESTLKNGGRKFTMGFAA